MSAPLNSLLRLTQDPAPPALKADSALAAALEDILGASESRHTRRAYKAQFSKFRSWCERYEVSAIPADPGVIASYIAHLTAIEHRAVATVRLALASISSAHRAAGLVLDLREPRIRGALKGIQKLYARPQRQVRPLHVDVLRDIMLTAGDTPLERRDAALMLLLFAGALRRSELAGLDWVRVDNGTGSLKIATDALEITLLRSKARSEPVTILIPTRSNPGLIDALGRWVEISGIRPGDALFQSLNKGGRVQGRISDGGVALIVKARIAKHLIRNGMTPTAAATVASDFSGHSGRVGFYTAAAEASLPIDAVSAFARHSNLNVATRYARHADQLRRAPSRHAALSL